jgi:23S rRNA (cytosine1962-C5)-methyltransferase
MMSAGVERFREEIVAALQEVLSPRGILARNDVPLRAREGLPLVVEVLAGEVPEDIRIEENGIRYLAAPWTGQKTGAFLDQRENRAMLGQLAAGNALDCFSYHGSFALHLARGAASVTAVDSSGPALARARQNAALNGFGNIEMVEANVFDFLRDAERDGARYDTIVLDPPAFAKTRGALAGALRGYKEINLRAMRLLRPGGTLFTASCSFHLSRAAFSEMLSEAAADSGRVIQLLRFTGQARDHPEILGIPETGYLKGAVLTALA